MIIENNTLVLCMTEHLPNNYIECWVTDIMLIFNPSAATILLLIEIVKKKGNTKTNFGISFHHPNIEGKAPLQMNLNV